MWALKAEKAACTLRGGARTAMSVHGQEVPPLGKMLARPSGCYTPGRGRCERGCLRSCGWPLRTCWRGRRSVAGTAAGAWRCEPSSCAGASADAVGRRRVEQKNRLPRRNLKTTPPWSSSRARHQPIIVCRATPSSPLGARKC